MGPLIQILEQYGPELEDKAGAALETATQFVEEEGPVLEGEIETYGKALADKVGAAADTAELEGRALLDKAGELFSDAETCETTSSCPLDKAAKSVWDLNPLERGRQIEDTLGSNLTSNYPVIDNFENGVATSIKSIDLEAKSYQNMSTLSRTLNSYIDKVANFQGRIWGVDNIKAADITSRVLDVAVPPGATAAQQNVINSAIQYGTSQGVTVNVITIP